MESPNKVIGKKESTRYAEGNNPRFINNPSPPPRVLEMISLRDSNAISPISTRKCIAVDEMKRLEPEEVIPHLCFMAHGCYAHTPTSEKLIIPFGFQPLDPASIGINLQSLQGHVEILDGSVENKTGQSSKTEKCFVDRTTGLKILVSINIEMKAIILAFGDANSLLPELKEDAKKAQRSHYTSVAVNLVGSKNALYQQANYMSMEIIDLLSRNSNFRDFTFTLAGQSLGGSLAQFVGLMNGIKSMCYNAVPLGKGQQALIGTEKLNIAHLYITHVTVESDYVNETTKITTAYNFGNRYSIPTAYQRMQATHAFVLGSAMKYLGQNERTLPHDLRRTNPEFFANIPKITPSECTNAQDRQYWALMKLRCANRAYRSAIDSFFLDCISTQYNPTALIPFSIFQYPTEGEFSHSRFINHYFYKTLLYYRYAANNPQYQALRVYKQNFDSHIQNWIQGCSDSKFKYNFVKYSNDINIEFYKTRARLNSKSSEDAYLLSKFIESYIFSKKFIDDFKVANLRDQFLKFSNFFWWYQCYSSIDRILRDLIFKIKVYINSNSIDLGMSLQFLGRFLEASNLTPKTYFSELVSLAIENLNHSLWKIQLESLKLLTVLVEQNNVISNDDFGKFVQWAIKDNQNAKLEVRSTVRRLVELFQNKGYRSQADFEKLGSISLLGFAADAVESMTTVYSGQFSQAFSKEVFENTINNIIIPSTRLVSSQGQNGEPIEFSFLEDASNELERKLDNAKNSNEMEFIDDSNNSFLLKGQLLYPKFDSIGKKQCIVDFIKNARQFYVEKYGEGDADKKLLSFSEKIIGLSHFNINGEDVVFSDQAVKDLNRMQYFTVDESGKATLLVDFEKNPCPNEGEELDKWLEDRIKSLMEYCGYKENGNEEANKIALQNLKILFSVANQKLAIAYNDKSESENCNQRLSDGFAFIIPANSMTNTIIVSKKEGRFLLKNSTVSENLQWVYSRKAPKGIVYVDKKESFCRVESGIYFVPNMNGELEPKEYCEGMLEYKIVEGGLWNS